MKSQKWYDAIKVANSKPKSDEHKAKIAASKRGRPIVFSNPEERAAKISAAQKGRVFSPEHAAKLAEARRNSPKWRAAVAEANRLNKKGKPIVFSDPEGRAEKIRSSLNQPEINAKLRSGLRGLWASRTEEERRAIGEKSSKTQRGRSLSAEHLANLRQANSQPRTEEHKRKLSESNIGRESWNTGLTKETHPSLLSTSQKQIGRVPDYNKYRSHYEGPKGKILMRSRWEVAYAEYLDREGVDWEYEPRFFVIGAGEYIGHTYTPDFRLSATDEWIEIKGRMTAENQRKTDRFRERYPQENLSILGKPELCAMGIMDKHGRLGR